MSKTTQAIPDFIEQLNHPLEEVIFSLRKTILQAENSLTEHIKWNAPSFCHNGDDRITFNFPPKKDSILLVFHRGAKTRDVPKERLISDVSGLLEWKTNDRAIARFANLAEVEIRRSDLERAVKDWVASCCEK